MPYKVNLKGYINILMNKTFPDTEMQIIMSEQVQKYFW